MWAKFKDRMWNLVPAFAIGGVTLFFVTFVWLIIKFSVSLSNQVYVLTIFQSTSEGLKLVAEIPVRQIERKSDGSLCYLVNDSEYRVCVKAEAYILTELHLE